jgi:hypothetical protein
MHMWSRHSGDDICHVQQRPPCLPSYLEVPAERTTLSREYMSGIYSIYVYSVSKLLLDLPLALL